MTAYPPDPRQSDRTPVVAPSPRPYRIGPPAHREQSVFPVAPASYPGFWRGPRWRWWKALVILAAGGLFFLLDQTLAILIAATIDALSGRVPFSTFVTSASQGTIVTTPAIFIANNLSLVVLVPAAMLIPEFQAWGSFMWWVAWGFVSNMGGVLRRQR